LQGGQHSRIYSKEKQFEFEVCSSARFPGAAIFVIHVRIDSVIKPYKFKVCSAMLIRACNINRHSRVKSHHTCSIIYTEAGHFKRDVQIYSREKQYKWKFCTAKFYHDL